MTTALWIVTILMTAGLSFVLGMAYEFKTHSKKWNKKMNVLQEASKDRENQLKGILTSIREITTLQADS